MNRRLPIALASALVLAGLVAPAQEAVPPRPASAGAAKAEPPAPPNEPTRVTLDFRARPIAEVIRTIAARTGGMVDTFNTNDARWAEPITLDSPEPVPFWEALDRLTVAANLTRSVADAGPLGTPRPHVQFSANYGPATAAAQAAEEGAVAYVGPFRVGPVTIHDRSARAFHEPPNGAGEEAPGLQAEIALMAEPALMAVPAGPIRRVEAVDQAGRSWLDPKLKGEVPDDGRATQMGVPPSLKIPLVRGDGAGGPSRLKMLRMAVPLEVARRPPAPAADVPLEGAEGQTYRAGELAVTVREFKVESGRPSIKLVARIEGRDAEPPSRTSARLWAAFYHRIEVVDAKGNPVHVAGGGAGITGTDPREFSIQYTYVVTAEPGRGQPARLRLYRADWVAWEMPLEFREVPVP